MTKKPSRSPRLIAAMHHAALKALAAAPNGELQKRSLLQAIESNVPLDDWALAVYDNGSGFGQGRLCHQIFSWHVGYHRRRPRRSERIF